MLLKNLFVIWKGIPKELPRVQGAIKKPDVLVQLHFNDFFEEFMRTFQHDELQIHVLYKDMANQVKTFLLRLVKGEVVASVTLQGLAKLDVSRRGRCRACYWRTDASGSKEIKRGSAKGCFLRNAIILHNSGKFSANQTSSWKQTSFFA